MNTDPISTFQEQKEGYICPSCRLLFSTIPNVKGNGVICPGCEKLLTVPVLEDGIFSQKPNEMPYQAAGFSSMDQMEEDFWCKRQRELHRHEEVKIEAQDNELRWMVPVALIAIMCVGGLIYVLLGSTTDKPIIANDSIDDGVEVEATEYHKNFEHTDTEDLKQLEEYLEKVLAAESVDDLLPLVRNTEKLQEKMLKYYGGEKISPTKMNHFKKCEDMSLFPGYMAATFESGDFEIKNAIIKYDDGLFELDWESYVSYSDISWEKMRELKPVQPFVMRVTLSEKNFYLEDFSDEKAWQSVSLTNPNEEGTMFGYVKRDTAVEQLVSNFGMTTSNYNLTVLAKYSEGATSDNQVEIIEVISNSWLVEGE